MRSKKALQRMRELDEDMEKTTYSVYKRDPELDASILDKGAYRKPNLPKPDIPNFKFFDTELQALKQVQPLADYMEELLANNGWIEGAQTYKGQTLWRAFERYKKDAKETSLWDEIRYRHGRITALETFERMDGLCSEVRIRGSYRLSYSNFWDLGFSPTSTPGTGENGDSMRVQETAPNIKWDEITSSSSSASSTPGASGSGTQRET